MALELPSSFFSLLNESITLFNRNVTLIYPGTQEECPNCVLDVFGNRSSNRYKAGGPENFEAGSPCPYCNGAGFKYVEQEENIVLRVYWDRASWTKPLPLNLPDGAIQTITKIDYLNKIEMCSYMRLRYDNISDFKTMDYVRVGTSYPQGFVQNAQKYVFTFWQMK